MTSVLSLVNLSITLSLEFTQLPYSSVWLNYGLVAYLLFPFNLGSQPVLLHYCHILYIILENSSNFYIQKTTKDRRIKGKWNF